MGRVVRDMQFSSVTAVSHLVGTFTGIMVVICQM